LNTEQGGVSYTPTEAAACAKAAPVHRQRLEVNALLCVRVSGGAWSLVRDSTRVINEHGNNSLFYTAVEKKSMLAVLWHVSCVAY